MVLLNADGKVKQTWELEDKRTSFLTQWEAVRDVAQGGEVPEYMSLAAAERDMEVCDLI